MTEEETPDLENAEAPEGTSEPDAELPDKFKGKSAAEIAKAHEELERKLGDQGREFGEYKKALEQMQSELAYYRNAPQQPQTQRQPEPSEDWDTKFFESPTKAIDSYLGKKFQEYDRYSKEQYARRESPRVLADLRRSEPEIFGDPEVEANTLKFVNYAISQGGDPSMLADSNALLAVGLNMKYYKDKKNPARNPVSPTATETPSAVKSKEPTAKHVEFSDKDKSFISYLAERAPDLGIKSMKDAAELLDEEESR